MKKYYLIVQGQADLIYLGKFRSISEAKKFVTYPRHGAARVILTKAELKSLALQSENSELKD
jgi:hypothetical protein